MADRIISMRTKLYDTLTKLETPGEWGHIKSQIGMFSFTGLNPDQVEQLAQKASIYLTKDGRISMAGLNEGNVEVSSPCLQPRSIEAVVFDEEGALRC